MLENRNPYAPPSEPGQASVAPVESKPWWTKGLLVFAAMMLAAYLVLPALLLLFWLTSGSPDLRDVFSLGLGPALGWFLFFPLPLLGGYALAIFLILNSVTNFNIRCVLIALTLVVYTVAVFIWFVVYAVAG